MNATCLKMVGGRQEEQVAERLRKPVSGTVAGGSGPAGRSWSDFRVWSGGFPRKRSRRGLLWPVCVEGDRNPMRVVLGREAQDRVFE